MLCTLLKASRRKEELSSLSPSELTTLVRVCSSSPSQSLERGQPGRASGVWGRLSRACTLIAAGLFSHPHRSPPPFPVLGVLMNLQSLHHLTPLGRGHQDSASLQGFHRRRLPSRVSNPPSVSVCYCLTRLKKLRTSGEKHNHTER